VRLLGVTLSNFESEARRQMALALAGVPLDP